LVSTLIPIDPEVIRQDPAGAHDHCVVATFISARLLQQHESARIRDL